MEGIKFLQFSREREKECSGAFSIFGDSFGLVTSWEFAERDPFAESSALPHDPLHPHFRNPTLKIFGTHILCL